MENPVPSPRTAWEAARDPEYVRQELARYRALVPPEQLPPAALDTSAPTLPIIIAGPRLIEVNAERWMLSSVETYNLNAFLVKARGAGLELSMSEIIDFWHELEPRAQSHHIQDSRSFVANLNKHANATIITQEGDDSNPLFIMAYNLFPKNPGRRTSPKTAAQLGGVAGRAGVVAAIPEEYTLEAPTNPLNTIEIRRKASQFFCEQYASALRFHAEPDGISAYSGDDPFERYCDRATLYEDVSERMLSRLLASTHKGYEIVEQQLHAAPGATVAATIQALEQSSYYKKTAFSCFGS
jgi:hypothetical protein